MPTSDIIFAVIGVVDYLFILAFIVWTGVVTRKEALGKNQKGSELAK